MVFASPDFNAEALRGQNSASKEGRPSKPGKTAPRLIHDVLVHDPRGGLTPFDILAHPAPHFDGTHTQPLISPNACRHEYALNAPRCRFPPKEYRPAAGDHFHVEALCRKCRIHLFVGIKYSPTGRKPCPTPQHPLHHFITREVEPGSEYRFGCSSPDCDAFLTIKYHPSVVSDSDLDLLTNPSLLKKRYEEAVKTNPDRQGFILATPVATLWKLRRYVRDSLNPASAGKKIPTENKRYVESFSEETDEIFRRLGFKFEVEEDTASWALPQTSPNSSSSDRVFLENWDMELQAVIEQASARDGDLNPCPEYIWLPARNEIDRILSAQNYAKSAQARQESNDPTQDHPYYACLGALRDFADNLIEFAWDRQTACDPQQANYYFDCLQDLARGRDSESLLVRVAMLESQGFIGEKAINEAYKFFNLDPKTTITDDRIINLYRSRLEDTSPNRHHELRGMLKRIGMHRRSDQITDAADDTLNTYEQALAWLGAEKDYPDDSILTLHTTKVADNAASEASARRAVQIIADSRNSDSLKSWLSTGEMRDTGMSVDEACKHLKIQLDTVDDTTLQLVIDGARKDNPGWKTDKAIDTVTKAYQRPKTGPAHDPETWPVGLTSHGNTCYLNSLLQYYFTIKPLRDLVLNFDDHKFDLSRHGGKSQRVGARRVTPLEIRAYQKFVDDLRHLFERMIKDRGPAVKPDADLVCRAFLKAEDTETQTAPGSRAQSPPADIGIEQPPPKPPRPTVMTDTGVKQVERAPSTASSATLGENEMLMPDAMVTSQILPPSPPGTPPAPGDAKADPEALAPPLPPRPVSTPVRQQTNLSKAEEAARQQQDVTEVMDEILFRLRCAIDPEGQDIREEQLDAFRNIFYMRISEKTLGDGGKISSREEYALNILLNIPSRPTDIYAALDEVFELQTIDHGEKKLRQYKTIQELPPVLQINIPRNTYDRTTGRGVKVEHKVHLEESLYLDRYFEWEKTDVMNRRQETWGWRQQLEVLQAQKDVINRNTVGLDGPAKLKTAAQYLRNLQKCNETLTSLDLVPIELDDSIINDLEAVAEVQQSQLKIMDEQIVTLQTRISTSFQDYKEIKYRLAAVFFHRGGYGHGHYWTCIYDFKNSMWRIYNDEKVDEFDKLNDIFDAETWQQGTPTYAVYVRDDVKETYVEPVCRAPEPLPAPTPVEPQQDKVDEVMEDAPPPQPPRHPPPTYPPPQPQQGDDWRSNSDDPNIIW